MKVRTKIDRPRVLVIGAGIVDSSVASYFTCLKAYVHLIDRSKDPSETTRASLGVLTHFEGGRDDYSSFYRDGHALHAELATQLADETGMDVGWRALGGFDLAFGDKEVDFLKQWLAVNGAKCECEWVDAQQLRSAESQISCGPEGRCPHSVLWGWFSGFRKGGFVHAVSGNQRLGPTTIHHRAQRAAPRAHLVRF